MARKLTERQKAVLLNVVRAWRADEWYRAADHGERVTLASLHTRGFLVRRTRRGVEGAADAAYEYQPAEAVLEVVLAATAAAVTQG